MKKENFENGNICRPESADEAFICQIEYTDPISKASIWLHKRLIRIIRCIESGKDWYVGKVDERPEKLLSEMFEPTQNTLCDRFRYYSEQLALYAPGQVPRGILEVDYRCGRILIARLYWCCRDAALIQRLTRAVEELKSQLTNEDRFGSETYKEDLGKCVTEIVNVFGSLSEYFTTIENDILHPERQGQSVERETLEVVKETQKVVKETRKVVVRMDEREKRARQNSRMTFDIDTQERVFAIWELGRSNPEVKRLAQNGRKTSHCDVFNYYARDLKAHGIVTLALFKACLAARSDRLRYKLGRKS